MSDFPLVSIILPTYNSSRYLSSAVESCLSQTYQKIELIIVDDCSTDNSAEIAVRYRNIDNRIKILSHQSNRGLPAALNTGFAAARGALYTWTSDDNLYNPDAVEKMVRFLSERGDVDIVFCDYDVIGERGDYLKTVITGPWEDLPIGDYIGACFLYRREVDKLAGGYNEALFCVEDYAFWLSAYNAGCRFERLGECLYQYRQHESSLSSQRREFILRKTLELIIENNSANVDKIPGKIRMRSYLRCASIAQVLSDRETARECLNRAIEINPEAPSFTRRELVEYASLR